MSGGSWDYLTFKVSDAADCLLRDKTTEYDELTELTDAQKEARHRFGNLLEKVAHALYEIELVDSGDSSTPKDIDAINEVFDFLRSIP